MNLYGDIPCYKFISMSMVGYLNYKALSRNPNITLGIVKENNNKSWDYKYMSENPNVTWDDVLSFGIELWDFTFLSKNPNITWDIVKDNPDKKWNYGYLSSNPSITWDIVKSNPSIEWGYSRLSRNPNITWDIVLANPDIEWSDYYLSKNINITWDIVQTNPGRDWDYDNLSSNPGITYDAVLINYQKPWNYEGMSKNPNLVWDDIYVANDVWSYHSIRDHPNVTPVMIWNGPRKWFTGNYTICSNYNPNVTWKDVHYNNEFSPHYSSFGKFDRWNMAAKIQHTFRRWKSSVSRYACTQLLVCEEIIGDTLPVEIYYHISMLAVVQVEVTCKTDIYDEHMCESKKSIRIADKKLIGNFYIPGTTSVT